MTSSTVQSQPLPPTPSAIDLLSASHTRVEGSTIVQSLISQPWNQWLLQVQQKVNVINAALAGWAGITPVTGVTPGTYGDTTHYPVVTVNANGLVTAITIESFSGGGSPLTTKGDLFTYTTTNARLPVGADASCLLADSTQPTGLRWGSQSSSSYIFVAEDQKAAHTDAGGSAAGANIRTLNTVMINTISGASLSGNQITLPAGTYHVTAQAPAYACDRCRLSLQDVTHSTMAILGTCVFGNSGSGDSVLSYINNYLSVSGTTVYQLSQYIQTGHGSDGLGVNSGDGQVEVYAGIFIEKIS